MKKSVLIPFAFAAFGVIAAPAFAADNTDYQSERNNMDSPEHIQKEYQQHDKAMKDAAKDGKSAKEAPDYNAERRNIDDPDHIRKEYQKHDKAMKDAAKDGKSTKDAPDYGAERRNIDDPDHIKKEYNKSMTKQSDVDE